MFVLRSTTKFLTELASLRLTFPTKRILMIKADVSDAFRKVRIDTDEAHNPLLHGKGVDRHRFLFDVWVVRVFRLLGRDVGRRRTRPL